MNRLALILAALVSLCVPSLAQAQAANLWIDTNGGTCTRQGTAGAYVDAQACSSMQTAIAACTPGDTIRMKAGTYGAQSISATKTTPGCTVIAETTTTIGGLTTNGAWYEIQNIVGSSWDISAKGTNNITCRDCNFTVGNPDIYWAVNGAAGTGTMYSNISWIGGSLTGFAAPNGTPCAVCIYAVNDVAGNGAYTVTNLLIDGVTFDDITNPIGSSNHFEAIRVDGNVNGLTIRRSKFTNIQAHSSAIFFTTFRGNAPTNFTFQNSVCENSVNVCMDANFQGSGAFSNFTFSYNTFRVQPWGTAEATSISNFVWVGNIGPRNTGQCNEGTSYTDNVWHGSSGGGCHASDLTTTTAAMNFAADGYTLLSGSAAIDNGGSGGNCIATDIRGFSRPVGAACDAGAFEFGATGGGGSPPAAPTNFRTVRSSDWLDRLWSASTSWYAMPAWVRRRALAGYSFN